MNAMPYFSKDVVREFVFIHAFHFHLLHVQMYFSCTSILPILRWILLILLEGDAVLLGA